MSYINHGSHQQDCVAAAMHDWHPVHVMIQHQFNWSSSLLWFVSRCQFQWECQPFFNQKDTNAFHRSLGIMLYCPLVLVCCFCCRLYVVHLLLVYRLLLACCAAFQTALLLLSISRQWCNLVAWRHTAADSCSAALASTAMGLTYYGSHTRCMVPVDMLSDLLEDCGALMNLCLICEQQQLWVPTYSDRQTDPPCRYQSLHCACSENINHASI